MISYWLFHLAIYRNAISRLVLWEQIHCNYYSNHLIILLPIVLHCDLSLWKENRNWVGVGGYIMRPQERLLPSTNPHFINRSNESNTLSHNVPVPSIWTMVCMLEESPTYVLLFYQTGVLFLWHWKPVLARHWPGVRITISKVIFVRKVPTDFKQHPDYHCVEQGLSLSEAVDLCNKQIFDFGCHSQNTDIHTPMLVYIF